MRRASVLLPFGRDQEESRTLQGVEDVQRQVGDSAIVRGIAVKGVALVAATDKVVAHGLTRQPVGWILTDVVTASGLAGNIKRIAWDARTMTLRSVLDATVDLWVF